MNINRMFRMASILVMLLMFSTSFSDLSGAVCDIVEMVTNAAGGVFAVVVVLAAVIYAGGQALGAEYRARANVWSHALIFGAIFGALIYVLLPLLIQKIAPSISSSCSNGPLSGSSTSSGDSSTGGGSSTESG